MSHTRIYAEAGSYIKINSDAPLIIMVRNDREHQRYLNEGGANFYGGFFSHFPALIQVPYGGHWNISVRWWGFSPEDINYSAELFREHLCNEPCPPDPSLGQQGPNAHYQSGRSPETEAMNAL